MAKGKLKLTLHKNRYWYFIFLITQRRRRGCNVEFGTGSKAVDQVRRYKGETAGYHWLRMVSRSAPFHFEFRYCNAGPSSQTRVSNVEKSDSAHLSHDVSARVVEMFHWLSNLSNIIWWVHLRLLIETVEIRLQISRLK